MTSSTRRDPGTAFPLSVLRELEAEGQVRLAEEHYGFTGATSTSGVHACSAS